jgi:hypothetical protein
LITLCFWLFIFSQTISYATQTAESNILNSVSTFSQSSNGLHFSKKGFSQTGKIHKKIKPRVYYFESNKTVIDTSTHIGIIKRRRYYINQKGEKIFVPVK